MLCINIKWSFCATSKKKICFFFLRLGPCCFALRLHTPPSLYLLSFQSSTPSLLFQPSIYPLENRGHCTNDYSDPGCCGNAAITDDRRASSTAKMVISKLVMEKARAAFVCRFSVGLQLTGVEGMGDWGQWNRKKPCKQSFSLVHARLLCERGTLFISVF